MRMFMVTALLGLLAWVLASTPDVDVNGVIGLDDARMQASAPASTSAPASASASDPASDLASAPASGLATICDAICVRRLLYKTAYSSASVGAGMAMDAMGTRAWCTSDDNKNWCPDTLNATLSAIAGRIIDGNGTAMPPDGSDVGAVARSLAEASRLAAIEAIVWAMHTVNGSTTPAVDNSTLAFSASSAAMKRARQAPAAGSGNSSSSDAVEKLKWTVWQLSQNETGTVDSGDLQTAMDAEPNLGSDQDQALGETTDDDDDGKKLLAGLTVGTGVPAALLGAFLGMKGCADPALCGIKDSRFLPRSNWFRFLLDAAKPKSKPAKTPEVDDFEPDESGEFPEWVTEEENGGIPYNKQVAHKDFGLDNAGKYSRIEELTSAEVTKYWRAELMNPETGVLSQKLLEYAPGEAMRGPANLLEQGLRPFKVVGDHVRHTTRDRVSWQRMEDLHELGNSAKEIGEWRRIGDDSAQALFKDDVPVLDSLGEPVVAAAGEAGALPELLTLEPVAAAGAGAAAAEAEPAAAVGAAAAAAGPGTALYNLLDSRGQRRVAWDGSRSVLKFTKSQRISEMQVTTSKTLESIEPPKNKSPTEQPPKDKSPKDDPPKDKSPETVTAAEPTTVTVETVKQPEPTPTITMTTVQQPEATSPANHEPDVHSQATPKAEGTPTHEEIYPTPTHKADVHSQAAPKAEGTPTHVEIYPTPTHKPAKTHKGKKKHTAKPTSAHSQAEPTHRPSKTHKSKPKTKGHTSAVSTHATSSTHHTSHTTSSASSTSPKKSHTTSTPTTMLTKAEHSKTHDPKPIQTPLGALPPPPTSIGRDWFPELPYMCSNQWHFQSGRYQSSKCDSCVGGLKKRCYKDFKCHWDKKSKSLVCKGGKDNEIINSKDPHPMSLDMPYQCTDDFKHYSKKHNPKVCSHCWKGDWVKCYEKLQCLRREGTAEIECMA